MCGRYSFSTTADKLKAQFGELEFGHDLSINFNVAPTQYAYVITNKHPNRLDYFRWGLIPYWAKDAKHAARLINARMEGISDKPSFSAPIRKRRCLVLADSFYEWKRTGKTKVPFRILSQQDELLVMAGIWDVWYHGEEPVYTFSIITTEPNKEVAPVHNRMPLVFSKQAQWKKWLSDLSLHEVLSMLSPPEDGLLKMYQVSDKVNYVKNNSPGLHDEAKGPASLFD
jgi:putative SOS response-associated peptidase YedK